MSTVKRITQITLSIVLLVILPAACSRATTQSPLYGEKIRYVQGEPLAFPDVTLEFVGKREAPLSSDYPQGMTFYDFKAYQGSQAKLISWSAGTGDIGPTLFELAGNSYALELAMSDELGSLAENELVLWQEAIPVTEAPPAAPAPTPPLTVVLDEPFSLALNQYGRLDGTELGVEFYALDEDTRCPQQETCESTGAASLTIFVWKTNIEPIEYDLNTDPAANKSTVTYDEYQIRLLSLEPYPETAEPGIDIQDYRATFVISK
ncbi:MAG: hypothetical protein H6657_15315 [Ardenticatenaceae bacterium]|nr:hypothetical protein [Ardenticatenaceae bacterium]